MEVDYQLAFDLAPVGLVLSHNRVIMDSNQHLCEMFGAERAQLVGQSFQVLYPSAAEYERMCARMLPILNASVVYGDDRIMRRLAGHCQGETSWCHVTGRMLNREAPHEAGIWTFEDMSARSPVTAGLTAREREVAAQLMGGMICVACGIYFFARSA